MKSVTLTAVSLSPLPSSSVLRDSLTDYLDQHPRPGDVLRGFADLLDRGEIPSGVSPVREHDEYMSDYREYAYRKSFRVSPEVRDQLRALSFATGLAQTAIIRLSLNRSATEIEHGNDPNQLELFDR